MEVESYHINYFCVKIKETDLGYINSLENAKYFHFLIVKDENVLSNNFGIKIICEILFNLYKKYELVMDIVYRKKIQKFIEKNNIKSYKNYIFKDKVISIPLYKEDMLEKILNERLISDLESMRIRVTKGQKSTEKSINCKHKLNFYKDDDYYKLCNPIVDIITWGLDYGDIEVVSFSLQNKDFIKAIEKTTENYDNIILCPQ